MTTGTLLFAHGARDPEWARPFDRAAGSAGCQAASPPCWLSWNSMQPDMDTAETAWLPQAAPRSP